MRWKWRWLGSRKRDTGRHNMEKNRKDFESVHLLFGLECDVPADRCMEASVSGELTDLRKSFQNKRKEQLLTNA